MALEILHEILVAARRGSLSLRPATASYSVKPYLTTAAVNTESLPMAGGILLDHFAFENASVPVQFM